MTSPYGHETHKTRRVFLQLLDRIQSGQLPPGGKLPSEAALGATYDVARTTVRLALQLLVEEGLVEKRAGSGSYVRLNAPSRSYIQGDISNAIMELRRMGRQSSVEVIDFGWVDPLPEVREALGIAAGEQVQRAVRVRSMDGLPFSYLVTQVPGRIGKTYTRDELSRIPLLDLLIRAGHKPVAATQEVSAVIAGPEIAAALGAELGSALIALTRVVRAADGSGMEYLQAYYRPDRYRLHMDLTRSAERKKWLPG